MTATRFQAQSPLSSRTRRRRQLFQRAMQALEQWSYAEIEVPLLAPYAELRDALGEERSSDLFRFPGRAGELLVLRGDITPLIAWQYANHLKQQALPTRVAYARRIARIEQEFARERSESYQLGAELIGRGGLAGDAELLVVLMDLLNRLGLEDAELRIGHVGIAGTIVDGVSNDEHVREQLYAAVRRRDRFAVDEITAALTIDDGSRSSLRRLCAIVPDFYDLERLAQRHGGAVAAAVGELLQLLDVLEELGYRDRVILDLSRRDDRGYYTGITFSVVAENADALLGGGGRYDALLGHFGCNLPAVGFGLNVERIVELLESKMDPVPEPLAPTAVGGERVVDALRDAMSLREQGQRVRVDGNTTTEG